MDGRPTPVQLTIYPDAESFRAAAAACFEADPIGTNLAGTVSAGAVAQPDVAPGTLWAVARSGADGQPLGLAIRTPPFPLHLTALPDDAATALARLLHAREEVLDLISGDARATAAFVQEWTELTASTATLAVQEGIHVLGTFVPPSGVAGTARTATPDDAPLVAAWLDAFAREVHPALPPLPLDLGRTARRLAGGTMLLWVAGEDGEHDGGGNAGGNGNAPVALAGWHRPSAGVSRIGPVFTPPEHRRHGYAAAVTAAATEAALAAGAERVMLFTDLANPTSNGVYARLGFRQVRTMSEWTLPSP